jgi:hypothetical protein
MSEVGSGLQQLCRGLLHEHVVDLARARVGQEGEEGERGVPVVGEARRGGGGGESVCKSTGNKISDLRPKNSLAKLLRYLGFET